ncbi:TetR/AcrR family transcriptional regulator [Bradyrhizobium sp. AUGA SZCCT0222]|uniref:TetR/AcrR family transcriptional regulator n=1 Tax=Bradyrhizobium sp. AUGA SZCCT0222 TaxID=2807668 RepID=UPI001BABF7B3|nr:TetR/AcrR family transcriptional regulator [Bradyrhizobium sp. AUGA SZCCT0222]MBR1268977.1 TetR/AcrR family transcriptional regulator [Bradyrhizobium sp. AUGA SZCCT0222]
MKPGPKIARRGQRAPIRRGGRPTKAEAQFVEDRILAAAAELFAKDGYAATSVERVASVCGAGKDTIYRRYPSKRALFDAVLGRSRSRIIARLDDIESHNPEHGSLTQLRDLTSCLLDINLDPELVAFKRIALSEMLVADGSCAAPEPDAIMKLLRSRIMQAQEDRHLIADDPSFLTEHLINSIIVGPTTLAMFGFKPLSSVQERQSYFDKAWKLFLGGAGSDR